MSILLRINAPGSIGVSTNLIIVDPGCMTADYNSFLHMYMFSKGAAVLAILDWDRCELVPQRGQLYRHFFYQP
jgi:hypothetical protein